MTTTKESPKSKDQSMVFNRFAYGAFVTLSIYLLAVNRDVANAAINFSIALVFDPFDQKVSWPNRPLYQRVWLFVHVILAIGLIIYLVSSGFNS